MNEMDIMSIQNFDAEYLCIRTQVKVPGHGDLFMSFTGFKEGLLTFKQGLNPPGIQLWKNEEMETVKKVFSTIMKSMEKVGQDGSQAPFRLEFDR
jgi:hypothetical protein